MCEINTNDIVHVRLTQAGVARYRKYYIDLAKKFNEPLESCMKRHELKPDADGWVRFQLAELMLIFGPAYLGAIFSTPPVFVNNTIRIRTT